MVRSKKRGGNLSPAARVFIRMAFALLATVVFAVVSVFASTAVVYATDDPGMHVSVGAYCALALTAVACGLFSAIFCRESAFLCALCTSGASACIMLAVAAFSGGVSPACVTFYAAFMLIAVLFAGIFSRRPQRGPKTRRR